MNRCWAPSMVRDMELSSPRTFCGPLLVDRDTGQDIAKLLHTALGEMNCHIHRVHRPIQDLFDCAPRAITLPQLLQWDGLKPGTAIGLVILAEDFVASAEENPANLWPLGSFCGNVGRCSCASLMKLSTKMSIVPSGFLNKFTATDPDPGPIFERYLWSIIFLRERYIFGR